MNKSEELYFAINNLRLTKYDIEYVPDLVKRQFNLLNRVWPDINDALQFVDTELAEVKELLLARKPYRRNHPENKEAFSEERLAEELGDALYMIIVTGIVSGTNPIDAMFDKMIRHLEKEKSSITEKKENGI